MFTVGIARQIVTQIELTGGASVNRNGKVLDATLGYMVGGVSREVVIPQDDDLLGYVTEFVIRHEHLVHESDRYFGAWLNTDTGKVHLDVSQLIVNPLQARRIAHERGELAIWNLATKREIRLEPSARFV